MTVKVSCGLDSITVLGFLYGTLESFLSIASKALTRVLRVSCLAQLSIRKEVLPMQVCMTSTSLSNGSNNTYICLAVIRIESLS